VATCDWVGRPQVSRSSPPLSLALLGSIGSAAAWLALLSLGLGALDSHGFCCWGELNGSVIQSFVSQHFEIYNVRTISFD
jgi:hypothetical protein